MAPGCLVGPIGITTPIDGRGRHAAIPRHDGDAGRAGCGDGAGLPHDNEKTRIIESGRLGIGPIDSDGLACRRTGGRNGYAGHLGDLSPRSGSGKNPKEGRDNEVANLHVNPLFKRSKRKRLHKVKTILNQPLKLTRIF